MSAIIEYRIVASISEVTLASAVQDLIANPPAGGEWRPLGAPFVKYTLTSANSFSNMFNVNLLSGIGSFETFYQAMVCYETRG